MEYLELILRELNGAVVVCDQHGRILLHSTAALRLFRNNPALAPGRSLYGVCARAPIAHTLRLVQQRVIGNDRAAAADIEAALVCATLDGTRLLSCRISMLHASSPAEAIFQCTFEDITRLITRDEKQGHRLQTMITGLRAPLTNLAAAAENLRDHPDMPVATRREFEEVVFRESREMLRRFETLVQETGTIQGMQWPVSDVSSADLIGCIAQKLREEGAGSVTMTGIPLWLRADSHALLCVLERLVRFVLRTCRVTALDMEALLGDRRVYLDIVWPGTPIAQPLLDEVLDEPLPDTAVGITGADVLRWHDSAVWSQKHRREGFSLLRLPLPDSALQWELPQHPSAVRRTFYDFSPLRQGPGALADRPLASLTWVVFDIETTGPRPDAGDEALAIAAVRVADGRILSGDCFATDIRPNRPVPEKTLAMLGLPSDTLHEALPPREALARFCAFIDDAVLVGHNAAFDMKFFQPSGETGGISPETPVLDTLALALVVAEDSSEYTLEGISRRFDLAIPGAHPTMGRCFGTAQLLLRLLDLLAARGIVTLGDAVFAAEQAATQRRERMARQPDLDGQNA